MAVKNKIFMWMWKHTSDSMPKNLENLKISDNLTKHRVGCHGDSVFQLCGVALTFALFEAFTFTCCVHCLKYLLLVVFTV